MENQDEVSSVESNDPLLQCLMIIIQYYHIHYSSESLTAGLPLVNHRLNPSLFLRASERAGFISKIIERPLKKISDLILPAVLILKNNECCILKKWVDSQTVEIIFPETGIQDSVRKSIQELNEHYTGYAILIHPAVETIHDNDLTHNKPKSWFWGTLWEYRHSYSEVILAALFINLFALVTPLFVMNVYDRVIANNAFVTLWSLAVGIFIIFICDLTLRFLRSYLIDTVGKRADVLMASDIFQQVLTMQMQDKPQSVGKFSSSLREFENLRDFFTSATLTSLIDLPFLILYIVLIAYLGEYIVIIPIITFIVAVTGAYLIQSPLNKSVQQALQSSAQKNAIIVESLTGIESIKSLGAEGLIQSKWEQAVSSNAKYGLRSRFLSGFVSHMTNFLQQIMTVLIVIVGVYEIKDNLITLGALIACSILAGRIMAPLSSLLNLATRYQQARQALTSLNKLMAMPSEYASRNKFLHREIIKGDIEFDKVTFHYPGQDQSKALNGVSFKVKAHEHVAILGRIGSGKSTLLRLALGLYPPESGSIYIDNIDILQIDPANLRHHVGYVQQDTLLFAGTARDNIAMSKPWASDAEILHAAKLSGADKFISHHPQGYGMPIGERGEGLSGGQRQTMVIARALLANPPILLLDEPTSSMDDGLEQEWIANMKEYLVGKTVLLSTHKGSLLALVDRIIILEGGKIVLDGPKDEVLKRISQKKS